MQRAALWYLFTVALVGCSGRYEVGEDPDFGSSAGKGGMVNEGTGGTAAAGGGAVGGRAAGGSAVGAGANGPGAGGNDGGAGNGTGATGVAGASAPSYCITRSNLPALEPPFLPPSRVWGRISKLIFGEEVASFDALPDATSVDWAGEVALQALAIAAREPGGAPGIGLFLRSWVGVDEHFVFTQDWGALASVDTARLATLLSRLDSRDSHRVGIFSDERWLTVYPRPTLRGLALRKALYAMEIPLPPPDVVQPLPATELGGTFRERLSRSVEGPACTACHALMDPVGFAFENFDELGKYRTTDNGRPVNASGVLTGSPDIRFTSARDLMPQLDESCEVAGPVARRFYADALKRVLDVSVAEGLGYEEDIDRITYTFARDRFRLRALTRAVAQSRAFLR